MLVCVLFSAWLLQHSLKTGMIGMKTTRWKRSSDPVQFWVTWAWALFLGVFMLIVLIREVFGW